MSPKKSATKKMEDSELYESLRHAQRLAAEAEAEVGSLLERLRDGESPEDVCAEADDIVATLKGAAEDLEMVSMTEA